MKHSEGFLKLVNDSKSRIREVTVEETQVRLAQNSNARLIDVPKTMNGTRVMQLEPYTWAKGLLSVTSRPRSQISLRS